MNKHEGAHSFDADPDEEKKEIPIPIHDPNDQLTVEQMKRDYPDWENHYDGDAELTAISYERTQALRKIGKERGIGGTIQAIGGDGLRWAIDNTPQEVGISYDAHGIAGKHDAVSELDQLLKGGIDPDRPFYSMSFIYSPEAGGTFGADRPITKGGFVVVAERNKKLQEAGIKCVVVGEEYSRVLDLIQKRYPDITFIPWHKAPAQFTKEVNDADGTNIASEELTEKNRPHYHLPNSSDPRSRTPSTPTLIPTPHDSKTETDDEVW
ncbi:hypothetical protein IID19_05700 [Patescibacteria group bacterium]|nr:hypothetical protein [Patescibacteria group bacterium]